MRDIVVYHLVIVTSTNWADYWSVIIECLGGGALPS